MPKISLVFLSSLVCCSFSFADYSGRLISVEYNDTVQAEVEDLDVTVTIQNIGTNPWTASGYPTWICMVYWEEKDILTKYSYQYVDSNDTSQASFTLMEELIPDSPGTYSYRLNSYYHDDSQPPNLYENMTDSPKDIKITVTPAPPKYSISGFVGDSGDNGISEVVMNGFPEETITDSSGYYSTTVFQNWSGTINPWKTGYLFDPHSRIYTEVASDQTNQNYAGVAQYTISGLVQDPDGKGISRVAMNGFPGEPTTNSIGNYSVTVSEGWSGTVTPTISGYHFDPLSRTYTSISSNQTGQDYMCLKYDGGSGTEGDPYQIGTAASWQLLDKSSDDRDKNFVLTADIDLEGDNVSIWDFRGVIDGCGHIIRNLDINSYPQAQVGLFRSIGPGGIVKNIGLEDANIECDYSVGGLCGENDGEIVNCYVANSVTVTVSYHYVGSLCGYNRGVIANCYATGSVNGNDAGGLCGQNKGLITNSYATGSVSGYGSGGLCGINSGTITNCYATGLVSGGYPVGGLCGINSGGDITNCYATGSVSGSKEIGGLCGKMYSAGAISNCYATGSVNGGSKDIGGLCGDMYQSTVSNCFWDIESSGMLTSDGGTGLSTVQMKTLSGFIEAAWDFTNESTNGTADIWRMCLDGTNYPRLAWEFDPDYLCPDGINIEDLFYLSFHWIDVYDFEDYTLFAEHWMEGVE